MSAEKIDLILAEILSMKKEMLAINFLKDQHD